MKNENAELLDEILNDLYGCHEDPTDLARRLAEHPDAGRLLAEARATKELLDGAARDAELGIEATAPTTGRAQVNDHGPHPSLDAALGSLLSDASSRGTARRPFARRVLVAAALLFLVLGVRPLLSWFEARSELREIEHTTFGLVLAGPSSVPDGAPFRIRAESWDLAGEPVAPALAWRALGDSDAVLASGSLPEGDGRSEGRDLEIPASLEGLRRVEVTATLFGAERRARLELGAAQAAPLVHLSSDKPAYRPGETAFLRATVLERLTLEPRQGACRLRIVDAKGAPVTSWNARLEEGVAPGSWRIPDDAAGGTYAFELRDREDAFTVEMLELLVQRYQPPRLAKTITLDRETYAPGAEGSAEVEVERVTGGVAAGAAIDGILVVDGEEVWSETLTADARGRAVFAFRVPDRVERGEARFLARVHDGAAVETAVEPFVVPLDRVVVDLYPEGGELVAGVPNRVYAEVTDPLGRPTSAKGRVVDDRGRTVTEFETVHQGRGRFELTPLASRTYRLEIDEPGADPATNRFDLPAPVEDAVLLHALADVTPPGAPVRLGVTTPGEGPWIVALFRRGALVAQDAVHGAGRHEIALELPADLPGAFGVLRATVFDAELRPVAERLVHRESGRTITVDVRPGSGRLLPGSKQSVELRATDETGRAVACLLGVSVTDRAVRDLVGETRVGLVDQVTLVGDVGDLEDVEEFLAGDAESRRNVDLLLGTRGWRRFAWVEPETLIAERGDEGRRLLALEGRVDVPNVVQAESRIPGGLAALEEQADRARRELVLGAALVGVGVTLFLLVSSALAGASRLRRWTAAAATLGTYVLLVATSRVAFEDVLREGVPSFRGDAVGLAPQADLDALGYQDADDVAQLRDLGYADEEPDLEVQNLVAPLGLIDRMKDLAAAGPQEMAAGPGADELFLGVRAPAPMAPPPLDLAEAEEDLDGQALQALGYVGEAMADDRLARVDRRRAAPVRLYAHRRTAPEGVRADFAETVYWNALLRTDRDGLARFAFDLSDRVTTWNVVVDAHGAGRVGQALGAFEAVPPVEVEADLPVELSAGDRLRIPVAVVCADTSLEVCDLVAEVSGPLRIVGDRSGFVRLAEGRGRALVEVEVTDAAEGDAPARIALVGRASGFTDRVVQDVRVVPRGFPHRVSKGGRLGGSTEILLGMPADALPGSVRLDLELFPSPLADLVAGLDGILRQPSGCFEQASSANYPNVLVLAYLDAAGVEAPAAMSRARGLLDSGYSKIAGYECSARGYEWFGSDPGHEALTAYGLLEFHDMAGVYDVDPEMVARTREWLLGRRDGQGGYERNERALDSFGRAPQEVTNAYVTCALAVTGEAPETLAVELDWLEARGLESEDPYVVALAASGLQAAGRLEPADAARDRLKTMQEEDGSLVAKQTSITASRGSDLAVETTSLAIQAWLDDPGDEAQVRRALDFVLAARKRGGTFGATQATIQALRALTAYARASRRVASPGELRVLVDDYLVATLPFEAGRRESLVVDGLLEHLEPGTNRIRLELTGGNEFPWSLELAYASEVPADDPDCPLDLRTTLGDGAEVRVEEGRTVPLHVEVENRTEDGLPMTLAIVGLPAGLEAPREVLEDLLEAGRFDLWETRGRELVLYWRDLAPGETKACDVDLLATTPGTTRGPASRAYLYYGADSKLWAEPLAAEVVPAR